MALTHRTPVEEVIARFTSEEQSRVSSTAVISLTETEKSKHRLFSFALPDLAKERLSGAGIYLSPYSYQVHSHPCCKTLENNILYNILPSYLDNSFYMISIKKNKVDFLKQRHKDLQLIECINRYVTSLDKVRYGSEFHISPSKKNPHFNCARKVGFENDPSIKDLLPQCVSDSPRRFFLHDEIHYWSKEALINFLTSVQPEMVLATVVYPPEILAGAKESLNPWCYKFQICGNDLIYAPDGCMQEAYIQPLSGCYLLKTSGIELPDGGFYSLDLVKSTFSHHLVCITKGKLINQKMRLFSGFEATSSKGISPLMRKVGSCFPIHPNLILRIYRYLRTLKKPDLQSSMAKLSQILPNPTGPEIKFFEEFSKLLLSCETVNTKLLPNIQKLIANFFIGLFPDSVARNFKVFQQMSLDNFISEMEEFNFSIQTSTISLSWLDDVRFVDLNFDIKPVDIDLMFKEGWGLVKEIAILERPREPYSLYKFENYDSQFTSLIPSVDFEGLAMALISYIIRSFKPLLPCSWYFENVRDMAVGVLIKGGLGKSVSIGCFISDLKRLFDSSVKSRLHQPPPIIFWEVSILWFFKRNRINCHYLRAYSENYCQADFNSFKIFKSRKFTEEISHGASLLNHCTSPIFFGVEHCLSVEINRSEEPASITQKVSTPDPDNYTAPPLFIHDCGGTRCAKLRSNCAALPSDFEFPDKINRTRVACFYSRKGDGYSYTGFSHKSMGWPSFLDQFLLDNQIALDDYDHCLVQKYSMGATLGWHSDNEECYDVNHQILTVNLFGEATFAVKCCLGSDQITLHPWDAFIMPHGFQISHKHSVLGSSEGRISLTFRKSKCGPSEASKILVPGAQGPGIPTPSDASHSLVQNLQVDIDGPVVELIRGKVGGKFGKGYQSDLCCCNMSWATDEDEPILETLRSLSFACGFSDVDRVLISDENSVTTLSSLLEVERGTLWCISGFILVKSNGEEVRIEEMTATNFMKMSIIGWSKNFLSLFFYKPKLGKGMQLRTHNEECELSDFTEQLFGCTVRLSRKFNPDDFHVFDVPGDGNCFWHSVGPLIGVDGLMLKGILRERCGRNGVTHKELLRQMAGDTWAEREAVAFFCSEYNIQLNILSISEGVTWIFKPQKVVKSSTLKCQDNHFMPCLPVNGCVVRAIASALGRREVDVLAILGKPEHRDLYEDACSGNGFSVYDLERLFEIFSIRARLDHQGSLICLNEDGKISAEFSLEKEHLIHLKELSLKKYSPVINDLHTVSKSALKLLMINGSEISYSPSVDRAQTLANSLHAGTTGVMCAETYNSRGHIMDGLEMNVTERKLCTIIGTFGCGKSTLFKKFISKSPGKAITFVSPRRSLADEIKSDIGLVGVNRKGCKGKDLKNVRVLTFELFLMGIASIKKGHTVIIDEIQLFPPGYLDLVLVCTSSDINLVLAGDPCQSDYDSKDDRHIFANSDSDIIHILNGKSYRYNILSQRFRNPVFSSRLPCSICPKRLTMDEEEYTLWDSITQFELAGGKNFPVILVSSFEEKKVVAAHLGLKMRCLTFGESTGLNFQKGAIFVSYESSLTSERRWLTALSRFSHEIHFINGLSIEWNNAMSLFHGKALNKFFSKRASHDDIIDLLPGKPEFIEGFQVNIGRDEEVRELKLSGDPWLKTAIFLGQQPDIEEEEMAEEIIQEDWFKTHIPVFPLEAVRARWVHKILAKEAREFRVGHEVTEQFTDEHSKNSGKQVTNAAERYETIYPRHKGTDSVTFLMAVKKRLSFSQPSVESAKLRRAMPFGKFLLQTFLKYVPLCSKHDSDLMSKSVHDFEEKKLSKSAATIENHSGRSSRDWPIDKALIFMKSQLCTKFDNRFRSAKAGQTLACFQHSVLCRFAPYMRYIEAKLFKALPERFYIHSGKNIDDLGAWVKKQNFSGECTESDYEAFDASQDHFILAFEIEIMRHLRLPEDLINDYIFIKCNLGSKLGSFAIMRFTGEASTFLFNTMANMLFTFLRYELSGHESICFAGDDMCANRRLRVRSTYKSFLEKIKLKAKVQFTNFPTFCGWGLCPEGVFKKPDLVLERLQIAVETNNLQNCIDNYAIEVSYAYSMGETLSKYLSEEEMDAHYNCVRFIVKHSHLLKCSVSDLFRSA
nr:RNA-dependent RNA polymerase [Peach chlorotic mottle virus]